MKIICAWCEKPLGFKCPFCGQALEEITLDGRVWYRCCEMLTQVYFDPDNMRVSHGICAACAAIAVNQITEGTERGPQAAQTERSNA
jgi:hypothetical protein